MSERLPRRKRARSATPARSGVAAGAKATSGARTKVVESAAIDARYGLEPVIDVADSGGSALLEGFVNLRCPYCDESYDVAVDLSGGTQTYIEDCQVCCQPISLQLRVNDAGEFASLEAERIDR